MRGTVAQRQRPSPPARITRPAPTCTPAVTGRPHMTLSLPALSKLHSCGSGASHLACAHGSLCRGRQMPPSLRTAASRSSCVMDRGEHGCWWGGNVLWGGGHHTVWWAPCAASSGLVLPQVPCQHHHPFAVRTVAQAPRWAAAPGRLAGCVCWSIWSWEVWRVFDAVDDTADAAKGARLRDQVCASACLACQGRGSWPMCGPHTPSPPGVPTMQHAVP